MKIDWYGFQKEYWEAWRVLPGQSVVKPEKPGLPPGPKGTNPTFELLYGNLGQGSKLLQERIQEKHCDWYVFAGVPDNPKAPTKGTKTASWTGTLYYVQNAEKLPATFREGGVKEAGPLFATQDSSQFKVVQDWVDKNKIAPSVTHSLTVTMYVDGYATKPTYVAGVSLWK